MAKRDDLVATIQGQTFAYDTPVALAASLEAQQIPLIRRWNRLEVRPRARDFDQAIRAEVRDPLWNLCKQWQVGEFIGEDAGSPAQASIHIEQSSFKQFAAGDNPLQPFDDSEPLEYRVERQPLNWSHGDRKMHLDMRLALGRRWRKLLAANGLVAEYAKFVTAYPVDRPDPDDPADADITAHSKVHQRVAMAAGRLMDGAALLAFLERDASHVASAGIAGLDAADATTIDLLGPDFVAWARALVGEPDAQQNGWREERLEYAAEIRTESPGGPAHFEDENLVADEIYDGRLDWYHFDREPPSVQPNPEELTVDPTVFIPSPLEFGGMPHPRWWQFEEGATNFGAIDPATSDIGKLLFLEHVLLYANDWYMFPYTVRAGSNALVRGLTVTNVFGERFWLQASGAKDSENWQGWGLFANSATDDILDNNDRHVTVLPTAPKIQDAQSQEAQMFIRDEMANNVWAIEQHVCTAAGTFARGAELAMETRRYFVDRIGAPVAAAQATDAAYRYDLMTRVPEQWIPFVPVHKDGDNRRTKLQRAAMPRLIEGDPNPPFRIRPRTQLIREGLDQIPREPMFVENEEVPRGGLQVFDGFRRTRWYNGATFIWRGVQKRTGRGEGSSGLAFDELVPKKVQKPVTNAPVPPVGHAPIEVTADPPPTISLAAHPDPVSGWNMEVTSTGHVVTPENASSAHVEGEGHMHLYLNGIKVTRLYERWFHLPALIPGKHEVAVELSANTHAALATGGARISASVEIEQQPVPAHMHPMGEEVVSDPGAPKVTLMVNPDAASGFNLHMLTENFTVSAENAGGAHVPGEGHLHVYINDVKAARVYGEWHYLPKLAGGTHTIKVALFTNDHRPYVKDGTPVESEVEVIVGEGGPAVGGGHVHP
ncbi:hypothetical protein [Aurantiacibacter sp. MUD61]|uniref:hypothetical protein n=1 Tax=Aurantiacibacter sp. MUD61 TaxID=3009083 RepID=UPI0022F0159E|nr:hypothetical protein [Aurantiacibacter sp. MUD61]